MIVLSTVSDSNIKWTDSVSIWNVYRIDLHIYIININAEEPPRNIAIAMPFYVAYIFYWKNSNQFALIQFF